MKRKGFLDGYKTYEPEAEGYGSPSQWKHAFRKRMSREEATVILDEDDPFALLGLHAKGPVPMSVLKKMYRIQAIKWHPDKNPENIDEATAKMQKINAAYDFLLYKFGY